MVLVPFPSTYIVTTTCIRVYLLIVERTSSKCVFSFTEIFWDLQMLASILVFSDCDISPRIFIIQFLPGFRGMLLYVINITVYNNLRNKFTSKKLFYSQIL